MAKTNIIFNNTAYTIDDSVLSDAKSTLTRHLSTVVNGVGATIVVDGVVYNIDAGKLSAATNKLLTHLETVQGNGIKVSINGIEYELDSTRLIDTFTSLNTALDTLANGGKTPEPETGNYLTFSSPKAFTLNIIDKTKYWNGTLEYSTDANTWKEWDGITTLSADNGLLYMRGTGNTYITGSRASFSRACWVLTGSEISCVGNIENLLDWSIVANGEHPTMTEGCYYNMFNSCTSLITAPELPATTLTNYCYSCMFNDCSGLTVAPELPATNLSSLCYNFMFSGCTGLTIAPKLPATTLASKCYSYMFYSCTNLITAPELPATTLTEGCYSNMFRGCAGLTTVPKLPATTLTSSCYGNMFYRCASIKLSTEQTDEYTIAYRIPISGEGTTALNAF